MKKNHDSERADELLKKLQASFLGSSKSKAKKEDEPNDDDLAFQQKLAALLNQATADAPKKKEKKAKKVPTIITPPAEDELDASIDAKEEASIEGKDPTPAMEEPAPPSSLDPKKKPTSRPRDLKQKKEKAKPAPTVEEAIVGEPAPTVEEVIVEKPAPTAEEVIVEEPAPTAEEVIVGEPAPTVEEVIIEKPAPTVEEVPPAPKRTATLIEPKPLSVKEELTMPLSIPLPSQPSTATKESQRKAPPAVSTKNPPSADASMQIRPRQSSTTIPAKDKDTIVIKPNNREQSQAEPIVIAPRNVKEKVTVSAESPVASDTPIRIGRPSAVTQPKKTADAPDFSKATAAATKSTATSAPTAKPGLPKMPPKPADTPTVPTSPKQAHISKKAAATATSSTPKRKVRSINRTPVTELPEEETYDEALDEVLSDEGEIRLEEIPYEEPEVSTPTAEPKKARGARQKALTKAKEDKTLPIYDLIKKKTGLDENDIAMIFELGYDNELGRIVGYENLKKLKAEHLRRVSQSDHKHYRTAFGYRGEEFTGSNRDSLIAAYARDRGVLVRRILFTAILTVLLLILDYPQWIGGEVLRLSEISPYLFPALSFLALVGTALLSFRQMNAGFRTFFKFSATPYSVLALMTPPILCYDLLQVIFPQNGMIKPGFVAALSFLLVAVADACRLAGEMKSFEILSTETEKTVLAPSAPRKKKLRYGDRIVKIVNDDAGEALYRVQTARDTTGFFRRNNAMDAAILPFSVMIPLAGAISLLSGLGYAVFCEASVFPALSVAMQVLLVSLPVTTVFAFFFPLCRANTLLARKNCTLVGQEAVEELSEPKTVIFDDVDMYTAQKCNEIAVRQSDDFKDDLYLAGVLFRKIGATLSGIGKTSPKSAEKDPPVTVVRITESGIEAVINNQHHVLAGSAEFLQKSGVRVPKETSDKALRRIGNVSIMYVAINSVLKLSYELEYRTYRSFEEMAHLLAEHNTAVAIHSYDPDLNDRFLRISRIDSAEPVRVIKPGRYEQASVIDVTDTGAVALGKKTDVAYPIYAANSVRLVQKHGMLLHLVTSVAGGILTGALALLGYADAVGILAITAFHLALFAVSWLHITLRLSGKSLHLKKSKK